METAVEVIDIHKNYSGENALAGVSFSVPKGCLFGLIGADGAGKSTLMRILTTLLNADKGTAKVLGHEVVKDFRYIRTQIGYMPQKFSLYPDLSVAENIMFFADIFGVKKTERDARTKRLLEFSRLASFQTRRAGNLSGGMKQKLALSCALVHTPQVLFLDEPTTGVDPVSRKEFWEILKELRSQGITILYSTPYMEEAEKSDSLLLLEHGKVLSAGTPAAVVGNYPYDLYKVEGEGSLVWPRGVRLPAGIASIHPAGGALHVASADKTLGEIQILAAVKLSVPACERAAKIDPNIEDAFVYQLTKK